jgi:hypothetical protein
MNERYVMANIKMPIKINADRTTEPLAEYISFELEQCDKPSANLKSRNVQSEFIQSINRLFNQPDETESTIEPPQNIEMNETESTIDPPQNIEMNETESTIEPPQNMEMNETESTIEPPKHIEMNETESTIDTPQNIEMNETESTIEPPQNMEKELSFALTITKEEIKRPPKKSAGHNTTFKNLHHNARTRHTVKNYSNS